MTIYCDASLVVAVLIREPMSDVVAGWMAAQAPADLIVSPWVSTEVASALALKQRTGAIDPALRERAAAAWTAMAASLSHVDVLAVDFGAAAKLVDKGRGLRAGDVLHVAITRRVSADLVTLDRAMSDAAMVAGVKVTSLS